MNEKKSLQDLIDYTAEKTGITKKAADSFFRTLLDITEEALSKNGIAKIKNLGTFKAIDIEERKSVNVQDGSEVIIPAHRKITFTPEKGLKEDINKPYAHLKTYVLKDEGPVDPDMDENEEEEEYIAEESNNNQSEVETAAQILQMITHPTEEKVEPIEPEVKVEEVAKAVEETIETVAENIEEETTEENVVSTSEPTVEEETNTTNTIEEIETNESNTQENRMENQEENKETQEELPIVNKEEATSANIDTQKEEEVSSKEEKAVEPTENEEDNSGSNKKWWLWLLLALILIIAALFATRYYLDQQKAKAPVSPTESVEPAEATEPIGTDDESEPDLFFNEDENKLDIHDEDPATEEEVLSEEESSQDQSNDDGIYRQEEKKISFDPDFVNYIQSNYPELHFPSNAAVQEIVEVKNGQTLRIVAEKVYGKRAYSLYLHYFNIDILKNPNDVKPGMKLKVPALDPSIVDPTSASSIRIADEVNKHFGWL